MTRRSAFLASVHGVDYHRGHVWATNPYGVSSLAYIVPNSDSEYGRLLLAAPLLYRAVDIALPMIDTIGMIFEANGLEDHVSALHQLEGGLNLAINVATNGPFIKNSC